MPKKKKFVWRGYCPVCGSDVKWKEEYCSDYCKRADEETMEMWRKI